ncbi:MAG: trypsin-like peptidase domain-containing protein [Planctomycetota bacterium]|nr:trypsin-like peptidase domain-containing protein [Planctomycetota bacterium]
MAKTSGLREASVIGGVLIGTVAGLILGHVLSSRPPVSEAGGEEPGATTKTLLDSSHAFRAAARKIAPSVVNIASYRHVMYVTDPFADFFGRDFFAPFLRRRAPREGKQLRGMGSGFIIDAKAGHILTNSHVVAGAEEWTVRLYDHREFQAKLVGIDPQTDLAVLQIDADNLTQAELGDSDRLEVGDWVLAAGNPFGHLEQTITAGIVSAKGRKGFGITNYEDFIQTDAAINPGNSGGPLVDLAGRVVGINTAIISRSGGYQGIGFAIPINQARTIADQLIRHGEVVRGWIGIEAAPVTVQQKGLFAGKESRGLLITALWRRSPAHLNGLRPNDIILKVDGREVRDSESFRDMIARSKPGTTITVTVLREGKLLDFNITLAKQPKDIED